MPKILAIAEKFSVAQALAENLPGSRVTEKDAQGFPKLFKVGDWVVTWAKGHILEQYAPQDYDLKYARWNIDDLPIRPQRWKMKPKKGLENRLKVIEQQLPKCDIVVHAGDPDREGQLLIDEILFYLKSNKPVQRILPNATDPVSIQRALKAVEDNTRYLPLFHAGVCRSRADWLIGYNLTRAATKALTNDQLVTLGRVQTPTLALVVAREDAIRNFKAKNFFEIEALVQTPAGQVKMAFAPAKEDLRLWDGAEASRIAAAMKGKSGTLNVETNPRKESPPLPYVLLTFQKDASRKFKWGVDKSLKVAQKLYEAKVVSYPRTDIPYLPDSQKGDVPVITGNLTQTPGLEDLAAMVHGKAVIRNSVFNSDKVIEHHGIVPTRMKADMLALDRDLAKGYELIARRYLTMLMPDHSYNETKAFMVWQDAAALFAEAGTKRQVTVGVTAKAVVEMGWKVTADASKDEGDRRTATIPNITNGMSAHVLDTRVVKRETSPPVRYTQATLAEDMTAVAKYVIDPELKAKLKANKGIGTPATQAPTITELIEKGYIYTEKDTLYPSEFGISIIRNVPQEITDPGVTALWESDLALIAEGKMNPKEFMDRIDEFSGKLLKDVLSRQGKSLIQGQRVMPKKAAAPRAPRGSSAKAYTSTKSTAAKGTSRTASERKKGI